MEQRRIDSHDMVAETIKQELLESGLLIICIPDFQHSDETTQRKKRKRSLILTIRMDSTQRANLKPGVYVN